MANFLKRSIPNLDRLKKKELLYTYKSTHFSNFSNLTINELYNKTEIPEFAMFLEFISNNEPKKHHSKDAHSNKGEADNPASCEEEKGKDQKA